MNTSSILRISLVLSVLFIISPLHAMATGESAYVTNMSPAGAINPGSMVTFYAASTGFVDPAYAVSDSFSASGATVGTIDKAGYFSWTPGIYDAGLHTLTISVTDPFKRSATTTTNILVASNSVILKDLSPGPVIAVRKPITFSLTAPGFITPQYSVYDSSYGSSISSRLVDSTGKFSWIPTTDDLGSHRLTIGVTDVYGHNAQTIQNITVINPTVSIQSVQPGTAVGVGSTFSFLAQGNMLTSPTYSVSDIFTGTSTVSTATTSSAGVFTWKPTSLDIGFHTLVATAADSYGNAASSTLMISVIPGTTNAFLPSASATPSSVVATTTATSTSATTKKYLFTTTLSIGSRGTAVTELQKRLATLGFFTGPINGYFGTLTAAAVKKYQKAKGFIQVGYVGPATRTALNKN